MTLLRALVFALSVVSIFAPSALAQPKDTLTVGLVSMIDTSPTVSVSLGWARAEGAKIETTLSANTSARSRVMGVLLWRAEWPKLPRPPAPRQPRERTRGHGRRPAAGRASNNQSPHAAWERSPTGRGARGAGGRDDR